MKVHCFTNLDLQNERWPDKLPALPTIGHEIQSATIWNDRFQLSLQVESITWKRNIRGDWEPHIELHMTDFQKQLSCRRRNTGCNCCTGSITAFYEWYAPLVGKTVAAFI